MRPELEQWDIQIVAICTDNPQQIQAGRAKHGLQGIFLADPQLSVTDRFGLRNRNVTVRPPGLPGLPVPTTLLIDAQGVVRWKDQSSDYVRRSDPTVVRTAMQGVFAA